MLVKFLETLFMTSIELNKGKIFILFLNYFLKIFRNNKQYEKKFLLFNYL
jgi:hypothetical protein